MDARMSQPQSNHIRVVGSEDCRPRLALSPVSPSDGRPDDSTPQRAQSDRSGRRLGSPGSGAEGRRRHTDPARSKAARRKGRRPDESTGRSTDVLNWSLTFQNQLRDENIQLGRQLARAGEAAAQRVAAMQAKLAAEHAEQVSRLEEGHSTAVEEIEYRAWRTVQDQQARVVALEERMAAERAEYTELTAKRQNDEEQHASTVRSLQMQVQQLTQEQARQVLLFAEELKQTTRRELAAMQAKLAAEHAEQVSRLEEGHSTAVAALNAEAAAKLDAEKAAHAKEPELEPEHEQAMEMLRRENIQLGRQLARAGEAAAQRVAAMQAKLAAEHAEQVSRLEEGHSTAMAALNAEAAAKLDAEKAAHAKSLEDAAAAAERASVRHADALATQQLQRERPEDEETTDDGESTEDEDTSSTALSDLWGEHEEAMEPEPELEPEHEQAMEMLRRENIQLRRQLERAEEAALQQPTISRQVYIDASVNDLKKELHSHGVTEQEVEEMLDQVRLLDDNELTTNGMNHLTEAAKLAAYSYTADKVYKKLNAALDRDDIGALTSFKHVRSHLGVAIESLRGSEGETLYRGENIDQSSYQEGERVTFKRYTSTSLAKSVTATFRGTGISLTLLGVPERIGGRIAQLSKYKAEKEVLLPPYATFTVVKKEVDTNGVCQVTLMYHSISPGPDLEPKRQPEYVLEPEPESESMLHIEINQDGYFGQQCDMTADQTAARKQRLQKDSNRMILWHQTDGDSAQKIIESGTMKVGIKGSAGGGIYFACTEEDTRKALRKGFVFICHVRLGEVWDIGTRPTWRDFIKDFGGVDYQHLQTQVPGGVYDSVKLETGSGPERVVYHSDQVEILMVRPCDGNLRYTDVGWTDCKELRNDPARLRLFLHGQTLTTALTALTTPATTTVPARPRRRHLRLKVSAILILSVCVFVIIVLLVKRNDEWEEQNE